MSNAYPAVDASPAPTLHVAFDGTLNGHWVVRYAVRMALALPEPRLTLLHVRDQALEERLLARHRTDVLADCEHGGVHVLEEELTNRGDVAAALLAAVPRGEQGLLVCGTRASARHGGLLAGSVAAALLRSGHCPVLALRVLTPGLLGDARRLLVPLAGRPGEARTVASWLRLLVPGASELHLLRVMETKQAVIDHAPREQLERLRRHGRAAATSAESELKAAIDLEPLAVDAHVRLDRDWTHAAGVVARSYRCDLLLAGGSDRQLAATRRRTPLERLLAVAPCDVGIYRGPR